MTLQRLILVVLALLLLALGWRHRESVARFLGAPPAAAVPAPSAAMDGDALPASAASAPPVARARPAGGVRKCRKSGGELVYTDGDCPSGSREQALTGGAVSVVSPVEAGMKPAAPARDPRAPAGAQEMREQMVERAVHGGR